MWLWPNLQETPAEDSVLQYDATSLRVSFPMVKKFMIIFGVNSS
jgi:hypothetical protein